MDISEKKKIHEAVFASLTTDNLQASSTFGIMASTSSSAAGKARPAVFILTIPVTPVFQVTPAYHTLPIQIQATFPHITLQLGSTLGCRKCPAIRCVIDTAVALSTDNIHFFAVIMKAYPHTAAAIHKQSNNSCITLSYIIQQGGASFTTKLIIGFQFHVPYLICAGTATTLSIATRPNVGVNTILGLWFIQQTKMIIVTFDQVTDLCALNACPFDLTSTFGMQCVFPSNQGQA